MHASDRIQWAGTSSHRAANPAYAMYCQQRALPASVSHAVLAFANAQEIRFGKMLVARRPQIEALLKRGCHALSQPARCSPASLASLGVRKIAGPCGAIGPQGVAGPQGPGGAQGLPDHPDPQDLRARRDCRGLPVRKECAAKADRRDQQARRATRDRQDPRAIAAKQGHPAPGPPGPPGPAATAALRGFNSSGDSVTCEENEVLVSAICKNAGGPPVLQGATVRCAGSAGIVGLCMRKPQ